MDRGDASATTDYKATIDGASRDLEEIKKYLSEISGIINKSEQTENVVGLKISIDGMRDAIDRILISKGDLKFIVLKLQDLSEEIRERDELLEKIIKDNSEREGIRDYFNQIDKRLEKVEGSIKLLSDGKGGGACCEVQKKEDNYELMFSAFYNGSFFAVALVTLIVAVIAGAGEVVRRKLSLRLVMSCLAGAILSTIINTFRLQHAQQAIHSNWINSAATNVPLSAATIGYSPHFRYSPNFSRISD